MGRGQTKKNIEVPKGSKASKKKQSTAGPSSSNDSIFCAACLPGRDPPEEETRTCPGCQNYFHNSCLQESCHEKTTRICFSPSLHGLDGRCPTWVSPKDHEIVIHNKVDLCIECVRWNRYKNKPLWKTSTPIIDVPNEECIGDDALIKMFEKYIIRQKNDIVLLRPRIWFNSDNSLNAKFKEMHTHFMEKIADKVQNKNSKCPYEVLYEYPFNIKLQKNVNTIMIDTPRTDGSSGYIQASPRDILASGTAVTLTENSTFNHYNNLLRSQVNIKGKYNMAIQVPDIQTDANSQGLQLDKAMDGLTMFITDPAVQIDGVQRKWAIAGVGGVSSMTHYEDNNLASVNIHIGLPDCPLTGGTKIWNGLVNNLSNNDRFNRIVASQTGEDCVGAIRSKNIVVLPETIIRKNLSTRMVFQQPGLIVLTNYKTAHLVFQDRSTLALARNLMPPSYVGQTDKEPICDCGDPSKEYLASFDGQNRLIQRNHGSDLSRLQQFREAMLQYTEFVEGKSKQDAWTYEIILMKDYPLYVPALQCTKLALQNDCLIIRNALNTQLHLDFEPSVVALQPNEFLVNFFTRQQYQQWMANFDSNLIDRHVTGFWRQQAEPKLVKQFARNLYVPNHTYCKPTVIDQLKSKSPSTRPVILADASSSSAASSSNLSRGKSSASFPSSFKTTAISTDSAEDVQFDAEVPMADIKMENIMEENEETDVVPIEGEGRTENIKTEKIMEQYEETDVVPIEGEGKTEKIVDDDNEDDVTVVQSILFRSSVEDLNTLNSENELNNFVMMDFLRLKTAERPDVMLYSSHFFTVAQGVAPPGKVGQMKYILFPIFMENMKHWILGVVNVEKRHIMVLNSIEANRENTLATYGPLIRTEITTRWNREQSLSHQAKRKAPIHLGFLQIPSYPFQKNCIDCEVFVLLYAEHVLLNPDRPQMNFGPNVINENRRRIKEELEYAISQRK